MERIPVSLITGFLGSGKTTLLNKLLHCDEAARTAVVVNEFGEIGLDHDLIETSGENIVLMANGCLCCAMRGDLVATLDRLIRGRRPDSEAPFERVMIETSGLADPGPVIQLLLAEPSITARYRLDCVIAVVDAVNGEATLDGHIESVRQVAVADRLFLTKTDLLGPESRTDTLMARLRAINPAAPLLVPPEIQAALLPEIRTPEYLTSEWMRADSYPDPNPKVATTPHDHRFTSFCYTREEPIPECALQLLIRSIEDNLGPRLLRIKGLVNVIERPEGPALIHGAQQLLHGIEWLDGWPSDDRRSRIIFITLDAEREFIEDLIAITNRIAANTWNAGIRASRMH